MAERHTVAIVGTGFAGIAMGLRLLEAGRRDFVILERADGIGGTWRDNHYPGAACDVPSHLYSLASEPNPEWSRAYASQEEILAYLERCVRQRGLTPHVRLRSGVAAAAYDEQAAHWRLTLDDGRTLLAQHLVAGCGGLSRPSVPGLPGLARFRGATFHSARWDHRVPLDGRRVAVVGTGASAIQIVPALAPRVQSLAVYQRTPPWILPKDDRAFTALERAVFRRAPAVQRLARALVYARLERRALAFIGYPRLMALGERWARAHLRRSVPDPALRAKLTPRYTMGCKRVLLSNDYYPAVSQPHVEVVTSPITSVTEDGIASEDGVRPFDAIVLATGFQAAEAGPPFPVRGRGGVSLEDTWRDGPEAYLGTTVHGFPNLYFIVGPNTGLGNNSMVFMIESQVAYIHSALEYLERRGLAACEVQASAQASFNDELARRFPGTVWASGCSSWYQTRTGRNTTLWPGTTLEFRYRTRTFDAERYTFTVARSQPQRGAASSPSVLARKASSSASM